MDVIGFLHFRIHFGYKIRLELSNGLDFANVTQDEGLFYESDILLANVSEKGFINIDCGLNLAKRYNELRCDGS